MSALGVDVVVPAGLAPSVVAFTVGAIGVSGVVSGFLSCKRSFGAPFTFAFFFFDAVSPFRPRGAVCVFSVLTSCTSGPAGVAAIFSFTLACLVATFSAFTCFSRELNRVFPPLTVLGANGSGSELAEISVVPFTGAIVDPGAVFAVSPWAITPPGVTAAEAAPSPTSVPVAVSSDPAGSEVRGAWP